MKTISENSIPAIIQNKIYEIRGQKLMLDFDLAELYEVETKVLNQAVKRNHFRFPEDFMFRLTLKEWDHMRSQIVTSSKKINLKSQFVTSSWGGARKLPYAFTEHGVTMLAQKGAEKKDWEERERIGFKK